MGGSLRGNEWWCAINVQRLCVSDEQYWPICALGIKHLLTCLLSLIPGNKVMSLSEAQNMKIAKRGKGEFTTDGMGGQNRANIMALTFGRHAFEHAKRRRSDAMRSTITHPAILVRDQITTGDNPPINLNGRIFHSPQTRSIRCNGANFGGFWRTAKSNVDAKKFHNARVWAEQDKTIKVKDVFSYVNNKLCCSARLKVQLYCKNFTVF